MPFTLRIHLTGLILFAPDPSPPRTDKRPRLHALLLKHGHHGGVHLPRLVFDRGHETQSSSRANHLRCRHLNNRLLSFENLGKGIDPQNGFGDPNNPRKLPKEVADLNEISKVEQLDREYTGPNPPDDVAARVTIFEGRYESCLPGASWTVEPPAKGWPRQLTTLITWAIDINQTSMTLPIQSLRGASIKEDLTLHPIDGAVDLWIYNATEDDLPPQKHKEPNQGDPAEHFEAYYLPFSTGKPVRPVLARKPTIPPRNPTPSDCKPSKKGEIDATFEAPSPRTANTPTCLTAQAEMQ